MVRKVGEVIAPCMDELRMRKQKLMRFKNTGIRMKRLRNVIKAY